MYKPKMSVLFVISVLLKKESETISGDIEGMISPIQIKILHSSHVQREISH